MTTERPDQRAPTGDGQPSPEPGGDAGRVAVHDQRWELLDNLQALLEPVMAVLGVVFLVLLLLDYGEAEIGLLDAGRVDGALQVIWVIFLLDFTLRLFVAPAKLSFLKANWLTVISLALPFLRPLRAFRALRAMRSMSLVRLLGGVNRGMRVLRLVARGRQFVFVGVLTVVMALAGAVGARFFEDGYGGSPIQTFGDAIWWSAALVTTMNNEKYVVSPEGRVLAILLRVYALSVFGYITASIATYFIGTAAPSEAEQDDRAALRAEIGGVRDEVVAMRRALRDGADAGDQGTARHAAHPE